MSIWTHVAACIRFDGIAGLMPAPKLGETCTFHSSPAIWKRCTVPCGSEGSLQYHVIEHPDTAAAWTCMIWGDLRNYDDVEEITNYFKLICTGQLVRQGVARIEVEDGPSITLHWENDKWLITN